MAEVLAAGDKASELQFSVKRAMIEICETVENCERVKQLLRIRKKISHKGDINAKLEEQKKVMEVLTALRDPVKRMIERAQNKHGDAIILMHPDDFKKRGENCGFGHHDVEFKELTKGWKKEG